MNTGDRPQMVARARIKELDALRFVAAAAVLLFHFTGAPAGQSLKLTRDNFPELAPITQFGHFGVELFFVISGFVILMTAWGRNTGEFATSRIARLYPAYWFSVLLSGAFLVAVGLQSDPALRWWHILPNLTMLQGGLGIPNLEGVYWTLFVELRFYVFIGVLVAVGLTRTRCLSFMTIWMLLSLAAQVIGSGLLKSLLVADYSPYFIAGMAIYIIRCYGSKLLPWILVAVTWGEVVVLYLRGSLPAENRYVAALIITAIFLVMILAATGRLTWLGHRRLALLGTLTYPLYLTHKTVARAIEHWLYPQLNRWTIFGLSVAAAILVATLVHRYVERPGARWLRAGCQRLLRQRRTAPSVVTSPAPVLTGAGQRDAGA